MDSLLMAQQTILLLEKAHHVCMARGIRLTPLRQRVLKILFEAAAPLGAYEIIERLGASLGQKTPPISVYRVLDFLCENHFIHRIESQNAFLACLHTHEVQEQVIFLLCVQCGQVEEATSSALHLTLTALMQPLSFVPHHASLEVKGVCRRCQNTAQGLSA
jgi:Fur family transcriptional regulator, zinc uptake regulator